MQYIKEEAGRVVFQKEYACHFYLLLEQGLQYSEQFSLQYSATNNVQNKKQCTVYCTVVLSKKMLEAGMKVSHRDEVGSTLNLGVCVKFTVKCGEQYSVQ